MKRLLLLAFLAHSTGAADFQAGVATIKITPPLPFWLTGYAARTNPASSVRSDLWAKALALQDGQGGRIVLVTTDLIGLPPEVSEPVAEHAKKKHGLERSQILLNSSHTHSGPAIWPNLRVMFEFEPTEQARVAQYAKKLAEDLSAVVDSALAVLKPARLSFGQGTAGFAINRRQPMAGGVRIGLNPGGPVDRGVPVLKVTGDDGTLRAVLFGYACHNTTLGGDYYQLDGDYAGMAQREIEQKHSGTAALFMMLCGGDQNPAPRGKYENVEHHGRELAQAVDTVLSGELRPVRPPIRTAHRLTRLDFAPRTREDFEAEVKSGDKFRQRRARLMLDAYSGGSGPKFQLQYPVQAVRFNSDLALLALGGEVVVDYSLRAKKEYPRETLVVAGYCNDVSCYIPSLRVLREGGYEPVDSMIYYAQPGPFTETVEERIFATIQDVMASVGAK